jgi:hypothetical protein
MEAPNALLLGTSPLELAHPRTDQEQTKFDRQNAGSVSQRCNFRAALGYLPKRVTVYPTLITKRLDCVLDGSRGAQRIRF